MLSSTFKFNLIILLPLLIITSCSDEDSSNRYSIDALSSNINTTDTDSGTTTTLLGDDDEDITSLSFVSDDTESTFSNLIIFGDSQTDMGNFPQSLYLNDDDGYVHSNLYNPISTPIDSDTFLTIDLGTLEFPDVNNEDDYSLITLSDDTQHICTTTENTSNSAYDVSCNTREHTSVGWIEYFTYNGLNSDYSLFSSMTLSSWVAYKTQSNTSRQISVNYAWYGALSFDTNICYNDAEDILTGITCNANGILASQNEYRTSQILVDNIAPESLSRSETSKSEVAVPTSHQQVTELFLLDVTPSLDSSDDDDLIVDDDTLYVFYTGANDLGAAFLEWIEGDIETVDFLEAVWTTIPEYVLGDGSSVYAMIDGLSDLSQDSGNILIIPQYNIGITPELNYLLQDDGIHLSTSKLEDLADLLGELVKIFNERLKLLTYQAASDYTAWNFYYLDAFYDNMGTLAFSDAYSDTFAQSCSVDDDIITVLTAGEATNCLDSNSDPYLFWNSKHLGSSGQQVLAVSALDLLTSDETILDVTVEQEYTYSKLEDIAEDINDFLEILEVL